MSSRTWVPFSMLFLFTILLLSSSHEVAAQQAVPLGRGPVHEAFVPPAADLILLQAIADKPPALIQEMVPPRCSDEASWISGYWSWEASINDFVWTSGVWRVSPPGRQWVPGEWKQFSSGWVWLRGFWSEQQLDKLIPVTKRPLEGLEEKIPEKPDENTFWVSGYWHYDLPSSDYKWLSGRWAQLDSNWVYVPAHYLWRDGGYIFVSAYWDRALEARGCAYSSVSIDPMYRETIIYEPWVVLSPDLIVEWCFLYYPDYVTLLWHHHHFHPGFWNGWCCVPPWSWWNSCWCFNGIDGWWLWWWWGHPGFPNPLWMNMAMSSHIAPPNEQLLEVLKKVPPPPNVLPWGVVNPGDMIDAIKDVTGKDDPILPADESKRNEIINTLKPQRDQQGEEQEPLRPTGNESDIKQQQPRPPIEITVPSTGNRGGNVELPPVPASPRPRDAAPTVPMPEIPKLQLPSLPSAPTLRVPRYSPPSQRPPSLPYRNPPSYMPPSYKPKPYPYPSSASRNVAPPSTNNGRTIHKPTIDSDGSTIRWPWRQPEGSQTPMPEKAPDGQRVYRFREDWRQRDQQNRNQTDQQQQKETGGYY